MSPSSGVVDLHSHVLPGIDDGPATLEESLDLARAAVAAGTTTIVATPHVSWDYPGNDADVVDAGVERVNGALRQAGIELEVVAGAEIAMTRVVDLPDEQLVRLRLGDGPYLLVECPFTPAVAGFEPLLSSLRERGYEIVLAHPERCPGFHRDVPMLERCVASGIALQLTASSLVGAFGRPVQAFSERLLRAGLVQIVASDAHAAIGCPPSILAELEQAGLAEQADLLTREAPLAVLNGTPLPTVAARPEPSRPGVLSRLLGR